MGNHISKLCTAAFVAALCGTASAYTLNGTVSDDNGSAVKDAKVTLTNLNQSATTDADGKFSIHEDENDQAIRMAQKLGSFSLNNGVLSFAQGRSTPVQVKVFDMMGNQVFSKTLQGTGSIDLNAVVDAQGTYLARVKLGSTQQTIRFNASSNHSGSFGTANKALLKEVAPGGEPLQVIADGFDTLNVKLMSLDTTVELKLTKSTPAEETFAFGYALKNAPRPSKGCGKDPVLKGTKQYQCQKKTSDAWPSASVDCSAQLFEINGREYYVTFPENYDKNKPYKLLFANHCMGSSANHMATWVSADRDHISPYYAQKAQDTEGNYIFVAPQGNGNGTWNGEEDHKFIHQILTHMEDNYCIDTTRVFATGFSFGAMFSNSLSWEMQDRLRAVAVYATAAFNIWLPSDKATTYKKKNLPIAWMGVHGTQDGVCPYKGTDPSRPGARDSALVEILRHNGKADASGKFTDASAEMSQLKEYSGGQHVCYDFTTTDPRFPVKWCSHGADHQWSATDNGDNSKSWVPALVHEFFEQF